MGTSVVVGEGRRRKALLLKPWRAAATSPMDRRVCRRISNSLFVASYTETALYLAKLCCRQCATTAIWIRTLYLVNTSPINYSVILQKYLSFNLKYFMKPSLECGISNILLFYQKKRASNWVYDYLPRPREYAFFKLHKWDHFIIQIRLILIVWTNRWQFWVSFSLGVCSSTICTKFNVQIGAGRHLILKGVWPSFLV